MFSREVQRPRLLCLVAGNEKPGDCHPPTMFRDTSSLTDTHMVRGNYVGRDDPWLIFQFEEMPDDLIFFSHGNMAQCFKEKPLDLGDPIEKWLDHKVLRHICPTVQQKSWNVNLVQTIDDTDGSNRRAPPISVIQSQPPCLITCPASRERRVDKTGHTWRN